MPVIADLHIHSRYSRATSKDGDVPHLDWWARRKGISIVGTGDCTHPAWRDELRSALVDDGSGLLTVREEARMPGAPALTATRFVLSGEISSIYKKHGRTRKVHNVVLLPSLESADRFAARLEAVGNIRSDGRPILGMDSRDLLELLLDTDPRAMLIPAHIWTPHFSLFGAFSGFDALEECFEDLSGEIHALETGLSSDPPMNWRVSALDRYLLVSNSDAHSPSKLGREANLLERCDSYDALRTALQTGNGFSGTVEFFPEEGKYHWDGHRACRMAVSPEEAERLNGICPVCGKRMTMGVEHRVMELADRPEGNRPASAKPFERLVPLTEVLEESIGAAADGPKVAAVYEELLRRAGSEFSVLREAPLEEIRAAAGELAAEGIRRVREGAVRLEPGFDGQYGRVTIFTAQERGAVSGQLSLFSAEQAVSAKARRSPAGMRIAGRRKAQEAELPAGDLNSAQREAAETGSRVTAVIAGPGTGKTRTLTARIAHLVESGIRPADITAVTFTNKAAAELRARLEGQLGGKRALRGMTIGTFHAVCLRLLRDDKRLVGAEESLRIAREAALETGSRLSAREALLAISNARLSDASDEPDPLTAAYVRRLEERGARDMDGLLLDALQSRRRPGPHILVDEYQDTNAVQRLLTEHWSAGGSLFVIGDADQSIYGFRGASAQCFAALEEVYPEMRVIALTENYRSTPEICSAACRAISRNSGGTRALDPKLAPGAAVRALAAESPSAEAVWISGEIGRMAGGLDMLTAAERRGGKTRAFSDIAVLCRTHRQLERIERSLLRADIPTAVVGRGSFLEDPLVEECLAFFEGLGAPEHPQEGEAAELLPIWRTKEPRLLLEAWTGRHGSSEAMERLMAASSEHATMPEMLSALLLGAEGDILRRAKDPTASGAVRLMTIHGAKGLEFPVVFLAGLTEGLFPAGTESRPADLEEERRLLFVGMTRAREELILTGSAPVSPFLAEAGIPVKAAKGRREAPRQLRLF